MSYEDEFSPAIKSAVSQLVRLIDQGIEFPDAVWKITQRTGFMSHELEKAYDSYCAQDFNFKDKN